MAKIAFCCWFIFSLVPSFFVIDLVTLFSIEFLINSFSVFFLRNLSSCSDIWRNLAYSSSGSGVKMCLLSSFSSTYFDFSGSMKIFSLYTEWMALLLGEICTSTFCSLMTLVTKNGPTHFAENFLFFPRKSWFSTNTMSPSLMLCGLDFTSWASLCFSPACRLLSMAICLAFFKI